MRNSESHQTRNHRRLVAAQHKRAHERTLMRTLGMPQIDTAQTAAILGDQLAERIITTKPELVSTISAMAIEAARHYAPAHLSHE